MGGKKVFDGGVQFVTPLPISVQAQNGKFTREYAKALKSGIPSVSISDSESSKSTVKAEEVVEAPKNRNLKKNELNGKTTTPNKQSSNKGASPNVTKQNKNAIENEKVDKTANGTDILSSNPATSVDERLETVAADPRKNVENAKSNSDPPPKPPVSEMCNVQTSNSDCCKANLTNPDSNGLDSQPLVSQPLVILDPNAKEFTPPVSIPHPSVFFQNHPYNVHAQPHPHPHAHGHAHPLTHTHPLPHPQMHFRGMEMQPIMYGPPESFAQGVIPVFAPGPQYPVMYTPLSPSPHPQMAHSTVPYAISQPSISSSVSSNPSLPVPSLPIPPVPFVPSPFPPTVNSSPTSSSIPPAPYPLSSSPSPVVPVPLTHGVVSPAVLPNPAETLQSSSMSSTDVSTSASENSTNRVDELSPEISETPSHSNSSFASSFLPSSSSSSSTSTTADTQPPLVSSSPSPVSSVQSPGFSPSVPMNPPFPLQPHFYDQSHVPMVIPHESNMQMVPPGNRMMVNHNGNFPMRPSYSSVRPVLPGVVPVFYPPLMPGQNYLGRENFSRILLLSNVPADIPDDQFKAELETYGKIRYLGLDRKMEGIIIVHYFDLRDARKLYFEIQKKYNGNYANNNDYKYYSQHSNHSHSNAGNLSEGFEDDKQKKGPGELLTQDFDEHFPEISCSKSKKESESSKPKTTEPSQQVKSEETSKPKVESSEKKSFLHFNLIAQFLFFINNTNKNININFQNQGTIVLFNVDSDVSNDDLKKMFGEFGLIKEIREIVGKRQKFIEYFDTRDSERAMDFYDGKEINGKKVKIEFSKPSTNQRRRQNSIPSLNSYPLTSINSYPAPSPSALPFSPYSHESPPVHQHPRSLNSKRSEAGVSDVEVVKNGEERGWEDSNEEKDKRRAKSNENGDQAAIEDGEKRDSNDKSFQSTANKGESGKEIFTGDQTNDDVSHPKSDGTTSDMKPEENFAVDNRFDNFYSVPPAYTLPNYSTFSQNGNFYTYTHPRQHYYYNPNQFVDGNQYGFPYGKFEDSQSDTSSKSESFSNRKSARVETKNFQSDGKNFRRKMFMNNRESDVQEKEDHYLPRNPRHNPNSKKGFSTADDLASQYTFDEFEVEFNDQKAPPRTTLMIKNIPNKYSQGMLLALLDSHCLKCNSQPLLPGESMSAYDFVYLPIDFKNRCNLGYAFVNFTSVEATLKLYRAFHAQQWEAFNSRKICQVTYARVQGRAALEEHFRNSRFACDTDEYLPLIFSPPRNGIICPPPIVAAGHLAGRTAGTSPSYASFRRNLANQTFSSGQSDAADSDEASEPVPSDSPCKVSESPLLDNPEALKVAAF